MSVVIVCVEMADGSPVDTAGQYLRSFDPDAETPEGYGAIQWTPHLSEAMGFPDVEAAWRCWTAQSTAQPLRPWDGRPNRPLTAFSIVMEVR